MGIGVLWARRELLERMPPYQSGSNMAHNVSLDASGAIGLAAALQFLKSLSYEKLRTNEVELTSYAVARLATFRRKNERRSGCFVEDYHAISGLNVTFLLTFPKVCLTYINE